jgi:hypothetical protein
MILPYRNVNNEECYPVDMSKLPKLFNDIERMFHSRESYMNQSRGSTRMAKSTNALEVVQVGAYKCSVAKNLADLDRLQADVFGFSSSPNTTNSNNSNNYRNVSQRTGFPTSNRISNSASHNTSRQPKMSQVLGLPNRIKTELAEYYGQGFGFLVCKIDTAAEFSPIGYVTRIIDKKMFIPTRHDHGEGSIPEWDHKIYVFGTSSPSIRTWRNDTTLALSGNVHVESARPSEVMPYIQVHFHQVNHTHLISFRFPTTLTQI